MSNLNTITPPIAPSVPTATRMSGDTQTSESPAGEFHTALSAASQQRQSASQSVPEESTEEHSPVAAESKPPAEKVDTTDTATTTPLQDTPASAVQSFFAYARNLGYQPPSDILTETETGDDSATADTSNLSQSANFSTVELPGTASNTGIAPAQQTVPDAELVSASPAFQTITISNVTTETKTDGETESPEAGDESDDTATTTDPSTLALLTGMQAANMLTPSPLATNTPTVATVATSDDISLPGLTGKSTETNAVTLDSLTGTEAENTTTTTAATAATAAMVPQAQAVPAIDTDPSSRTASSDPQHESFAESLQSMLSTTPQRETTASDSTAPALSVDTPSSIQTTSPVPTPQDAGSIPPMLRPENTANTSAPGREAINTPVGQTGWPEELGDQVTWMMDKNLNNAEIRLNPAHLGPLQVHIRMENDQMEIHFSSDQAAVREAIEAASPKLREMLVGQQINLADVSVTPPPQTQPDMGNQSGGFDRQPRYVYEGTLTAPGGTNTDADLAETGASSQRIPITNGSISFYA